MTTFLYILLALAVLLVMITLRVLDLLKIMVRQTIQVLAYSLTNVKI